MYKCNNIHVLLATIGLTTVLFCLPAVGNYNLLHPHQFLCKHTYQVLKNGKFIYPFVESLTEAKIKLRRKFNPLHSLNSKKKNYRLQFYTMCIEHTTV